MTDLLYSDVEEELRSSVRSLLAKTDESKLWRSLADLGCAGLPVPERLGGAGASWRETAVVLEELGRAVAPVPYLGSAVLATAALLAAGDEELLPALADGSRTAALAVSFATGAPGSLEVRQDRVSGQVRNVIDAATADVLLVVAGDDLYAVTEATRTPVISLDESRPLCDLSFDGVQGQRVGKSEAVRGALTAGAALLSAEQVGVADWCLETTVEYAKTRRQFARPIGSYQAIKHRLADVWVSLSQARAVSRYAVTCLSTGDPDTEVAAALAQAFCSPMAVRAAEECVQLHGGIGFTWEHPAHRYLKRAKADSIGLGTADRHRSVLAELVNLQK